MAITAIKRSSVYILMVLVMASCGQSPIFDSFKPLGGEWHADSIVEFTVPVEDVDETYAINVKMRHNANYPFANLYMFRKIKSNNGLEYQDTVNFIVADPRGKWLGKGVGEVKTMVWPYRANTIKFNTPGKYTFTLQQGMRQEALPGIMDIGLEVFVVTEE
jgi:gliding motility-associated lipoprotein GldH